MTQIQTHSLFSHAYDRANWKQFLGETFSTVRLYSNPEIILGIDTKTAQQAYRLGYIILNEDGIERQIAVFEVELSEGVILERNRVGLRNLLRKHWKDIDGAFVVYHNPNHNKWRFTYVSELTGYDADGEYIEIKTEPKRYTYVLGEGESVRTAIERFHLLAQKGSRATLDDIKETFSVEKLSNAFFDEYKKHYQLFNEFILSSHQAKQCFSDYTSDKEKDIRDFTKKLLGRIVFLYFIQKKGWMGVPVDGDWGEGDFNFLDNLFKEHNNPNDFYNKKLVKLFFDTLNTKRENDIIELIPGKPCRIPYLNGGLFEPEDINRNNIIFKGELFANLFEFFNQYNFTIYEDDPNDHTVAVDPEMLGHIFENLLEDNKDKGAFYTPKEIVHYMCQESLIEYLATDLKIEDKQLKEDITIFLKKHEVAEKIKPYLGQINSSLDKVKICDPAIGSGAFPMGLLQEIFMLKQTLWNYESGSLVDFPASDVKLNIIQNSIYGVDIEKGAVDIARLRFWLSLVVDENEPKALPNLDYKIVVGNSLVSTFNGEIITIDWEAREDKGTQTDIFGSADSHIKKRELLKLITQKQKDFFNPYSNKKTLISEIRNLKIDLLTTQLELMIGGDTTGNYTNLSNRQIIQNAENNLHKQSLIKAITKLHELKKQPDKALKFFDWKLDFPEVLNETVNPNPGFDIVIGNPPYIQLQKNSGFLAKKYESLGFQTFERTGDIYSLFYERGWRLLKHKGVLCYITSNKWMRSGYGKSTRKFFAENTNPIILIDFAGQKIFESATVDTNILMFSKDKNRQQTQACIVKEKPKGNLSVFVRQEANICSFDNDESWIILSPIEQSIKCKIEAVGTPLKDWDIQINYGIKTGFNEAFIISGEKRKELIAEDPKSDEIIRPILRGKDIKRYGYDFADRWLINTHNGVKEKGVKPIDINDYPAIKKHLDFYWDRIEKRADQGDTPYNLRNCAYMEVYLNV